LISDLRPLGGASLAIAIRWATPHGCEGL